MEKFSSCLSRGWCSELVWAGADLSPAEYNDTGVESI